MPRYRQLHTKIVDSEDFSAMPDDFCRMYWMLLTIIVDSEGRAIDNPAWIRSRMFPLRDDVSIGQINSAMDWLECRGMIARYQSKGRCYFYLPTFKQYQSGLDREAKSVLPTPDQLPTNSGVNQDKVLHSASVVVFESVVDSVVERPNVFKVYENEIGMLTQMIGEELEQAEKDYPQGWTEEALMEASKNNKRSWAYAKAILKRWKVEGRNNGSGARKTAYTDADGNVVMR